MSSSEDPQIDQCADGALPVLTADAWLQILHAKVRLRQALGYFLADDRFEVAVGGNPIVVDAMLARARQVYADTASDGSPTRQDGPSNSPGMNK